MSMDYTTEYNVYKCSQCGHIEVIDFWDQPPDECEKCSNKKLPESVCKELECTGGLEGCPGNPKCPAVQHMMKNPVDCTGVIDYMKKQIELTRKSGLAL